jgi:hypothetical protein
VESYVGRFDVCEVLNGGAKADIADGPSRAGSGQYQFCWNGVGPGSVRLSTGRERIKTRRRQRAMILPAGCCRLFPVRFTKGD